MLTVQNLTKSFGQTTVVSSLNFTVGREEIFALVGPSGCGKTTTLRLIIGFEQPDQGRIELLGQCIAGEGKKMPPEKREIGFVFQNYALFPHLNVIENVAFGVLQQYARSGLLSSVTLISNLHLEDIIQDVPIKEYYSTLEDRRYEISEAMDFFKSAPKTNFNEAIDVAIN